MAQEWDIKPRGSACMKCESAFADGETCFSALVYGEEGYARHDFCESCWPTVPEAASPYSTWKGIFHLPPAEPEEALKKETAESLLRRLMEEEEDRHANVIYILAVMLERKRELTERDVQTRDDGSLVRVYEMRRTGESFIIPDPQLRLDQIEEVQRQVMEMLGVGKEKEESKQPAAPEEPPTIDSEVASGKEIGLKEGFYSASSE